jgi:SAM-dependent methyltransferase
MNRKLDAKGYDTDKPPHYIESYQRFLKPYENREASLLELGVYKGGSLLMWRDYLTQGIIVGLDSNPPSVNDDSGRIHVYQGLQQDTALLDRIRQETAPGGFDIIIDDASHLGDLTRISFQHLFDNHLKPGGVYIIEDWGAGYWDSWPDGSSYSPRRLNRSEKMAEALLTRKGVSALGRKLRLYLALGLLSLQTARNIVFPRTTDHRFGMVGFVKELVDETAMNDITFPGLGISPFRPSRIARLEISLGQVFVMKSR